MVWFVVVAFDIGDDALVFAVSLVAPRTRRYCLTVSVHFVPTFDTFFAAHWSFIIIVKL